MNLSPELRGLVKNSVALLGEVIRRELGKPAYDKIETMRQTMTQLRGQSLDASIEVLQKQFKQLKKLSPQGRLDFARAYTLMLEIMNACENAYRSTQIKKRIGESPAGKPDSIIYVLTAHPTEARSPQNIWIFHQIQTVLTEVLAQSPRDMSDAQRNELEHWIELAWRTSTVRARKPRVQDEAEHIYSTMLREETLQTLLRASRDLAPIFLRSWVGGDKDGHPGVDEKTLHDSLALSRGFLFRYFEKRFQSIGEAVDLLMDFGGSSRALVAQVSRVKKSLKAVRKLSAGDAGRITRLRTDLQRLNETYQSVVGKSHPALGELHQLLKMFPALVVPLELREDSAVLLSSPTGKGLAIFRMLKTLAQLARGGDPRWYARGLIVSMTEKVEHLKVAAGLVKRGLGEVRLPIIPLFERAAALDDAVVIVQGMLGTPVLAKALSKYWGGYLEVMVGYSDSSKERGVLASRLKIAESMHALDAACRQSGVTPLFFQGSGGSVDRGGGTIQDQTAWWPSGALRNYKVTIQGEMVERSVASPEIARRQLERIAENAGRWVLAQSAPPYRSSEELRAFAARVAEHYASQIKDPAFLKMVEEATPYRFLNALKIGSRPSKRTKALSVDGLRAIPWVLCWTQTRVLFPTWWGVGRAWTEAGAAEKSALVQAYRKDALFATYVRALSFTLTKVELPIWKIYLDESSLHKAESEALWREFAREYAEAVNFTRTVLGQSTKNPPTADLMAWRPWLGESIALRAPMIHPLNLLQILALQARDFELLRMTVVGISSGMMTTG